MTDQSRIARLSSIIYSRTTRIDEYYQAHDLPSPSFAANAPSNLPLPEDLEGAREEIIAATSELQALIEGPLPHLTRLTSPRNNILLALQAIYRYSIAQVLAPTEVLTYEILAARCTPPLAASDARRLIRMAIANHVFFEPQRNHVAHSALSLAMRESSPTNSWVGLATEEMWPSAARTLDAMCRWPGSEEPSEAGSALKRAADESFWEVFKKDPRAKGRFVEGMVFCQSTPGMGTEHLFDDIRWDRSEEMKAAGWCPELMVDVGGSQGKLAADLLQQFPRIRKIIVQDLPDVVAAASIPAGLEERMEFCAHDFFEEQPIQGADAYLLRMVLHDWSDKYAIRILQALRPALKNGARIIVNDMCLPEPDTKMSTYNVQLMRGWDLCMKHGFNAKERDAAEWEELFRRADLNFHLQDIRCSPGALMSCIEVIWKYGTSFSSSSSASRP